ncbi:SAM-dependent methyltransferase [Mycobacterium camsae]|uniref:SAM-dependent methyltransferase n=1 Tax=Mycobacterium gordonae TaxID=1778 RepID=UPI001F1195AC|nr:SAM-dependent methyltransferase [Mycobacterium gordonae]
MSGLDYQVKQINSPGRYDGDDWDPASSVGVTATIVALWRALASRQPDALLDDPFAEPLVRAVGLEPIARVLDGEVVIGAITKERITARTRFFDDYFVVAGSSIRQAVIVAAGLDSRAYRLAWPPGTVVYEVDRPSVLNFKVETLDALGAVSKVDRRLVGVDLRDDWQAALRDAGFDPHQPTAWSVEGLLVYLPPSAQNLLFDTITVLSAPGSLLATEDVAGSDGLFDHRLPTLTEYWRRVGLDLDMAELVYRGQRDSVTGYLTSRGWEVSSHTAQEIYERNGFSFPAETPAASGETGFVTATLRKT